MADALPLEPTALIGRDQHAAEVGQLLRRTRLLTLAGAGGSGKTRLALRAARDAQPSFPDGVWWVELASLVDADQLAGRIARTLGIADAPGRAIEPAILG